MNTFFIHYWYVIKNFYKNLSITDIAIIIFIPSLFTLFVVALLAQIVHSQRAFLLSNLQFIRNSLPHIFALAVLFSRFIVHPEKTLHRILNSHGFYITLPLTRNTILHWCLIVNLVKDSIWVMLGFTFTAMLTHELNFPWLSYFGQTTQLMVLWVITASLISFVASIMRIILATRIQFEKKALLKLMFFAEILCSLFICTALIYFRIILAEYAMSYWAVNKTLINSIFFITILSFLYFIIHKLFSVYEQEIKKYFETETDYYSARVLPKNIQKIIGDSPPFVRSVLQLSLATRSYGFTKFHSLIVFSFQAILLLLLSLSISDPAASRIVFTIAATTTITMFYCTILVSLPFIYSIAKPLPLLFKEVTTSYFQGGLLLALPACILVLLLSLYLGLSGGLITMGISVLLCLCVIPLRMFIAFRYPYSRLLSDIAFLLGLFYLVLLFQLFFLLPIIGLILLVLYYQKKARELWGTVDLL